MPAVLIDLDAVARVAYEANRAFQRITGEEVDVPFDEIGDERRKLLAEVAGTAEGVSKEEQHEKWCAHKLADGWVYGEVKDIAAKVHPCLVPYDELPEHEKRKDVLWAAIVRAMTTPLA